MTEKTEYEDVEKKNMFDAIKVEHRRMIELQNESRMTLLNKIQQIKRRISFYHINNLFDKIAYQERVIEY